MMNSYGVLQNAPDCIEKLRKTQEYEKQIDGHAPGLSGKGLKHM